MFFDPYLIPSTQINLSWIINENIKAKTVSLLKESLRISVTLGKEGDFFSDEIWRKQ